MAGGRACWLQWSLHMEVKVDGGEGSAAVNGLLFLGWVAVDTEDLTNK